MHFDSRLTTTFITKYNIYHAKHILIAPIPRYALQINMIFHFRTYQLTEYDIPQKSVTWT